MKRSKKESMKKAASNFKSSPTLKGRQSVKVKYGLDETADQEPPPTLSGPASRKLGSNTSTAHQTKLTDTPTNFNVKAKANVDTTNAGQAHVKANKAPVQNGTPTGKYSPTVISNSNSHQKNLAKQSPFPKRGECEICRQPCRSHCAGCKRVFYCCKQHQQQDWSTHKFTCRSFSTPSQFAAASSTFSSRTNLPSVQCQPSSSSISTNSKSPELQFMIATKKVDVGTVLFIEKPLLVAANVLNSDAKIIWCSSCLKSITNTSDVNNNISKKSGLCPLCEIPLCCSCLQEIGKMDELISKRYLCGQGHSSEECALISDIQKKLDVFSFKPGDVKFAAESMKDLTILRVLMCRTSCPWRWESFLALRNSPRYGVCCNHSLGNIKNWLISTGGGQGGFPLSNYYMRNVCKDKTNLLEDVVKVVATFSEVSLQNPGLLVLYENFSWMAHACTPNAEQFFRQIPTNDSSYPPNSLEIVVKAVSAIKEGSKVTLNHMTDFEGGRSSLALKLFQSKGHYCCDSECACYEPKSLDKTIGIRCAIVFGSYSCPGIISPRSEAPNPDKANLGMGIFMKSKKWECDKCKKSEKYENLRSKILQAAQELGHACEKCCNSISITPTGTGKSQQYFLQLQNKLLANFSEHHWMAWKSKLKVLKNYTEAVGYGPQMLRFLMTNDTPNRNGIVYIVKQKSSFCGDGTEVKTGKAMGILELLSTRHGKLSPKRSHLLFDAFYANFIVFAEDYMKELPLAVGQSLVKRSQVAKEHSKKLGVLCNLLDQTVQSLRLTDGTTLSQSTAKVFETAQALQDVIVKVYGKVEQYPGLSLGFLNDLLEIYACHDQPFVLNCVRKSQAKADSFLCVLHGEDILDFEIESAHLAEVAFTFGSATTTAFPSTSRYATGTGSSCGFDMFGATGFTPKSKFGLDDFSSSSFGPSEVESESDIEDNDNPFVYSRSDKKTSYFTQCNSDNKTKSKAKKKPNTNKDEDWSSYLWFSSDDDDMDEFDTAGFTSSPSSTFGADLFNDVELEHLAEWAAMEFMMGQMNL